MTTATKVTAADKEFILDVFRRSKPGRRLTAAQIARFNRDHMDAGQVWATLDALVSNPDGSMRKAISGKREFYYIDDSPRAGDSTNTAPGESVTNTPQAAQDARKPIDRRWLVSLHCLPLQAPCAVCNGDGGRWAIDSQTGYDWRECACQKHGGSNAPF